MTSRDLALKSRFMPMEIAGGLGKTGAIVPLHRGKLKGASV
jgi:hypothetical protein